MKNFICVKNKLLSIFSCKLRFTLLLTGIILTTVLCTCKRTSDERDQITGRESSGFKVVVFGDAVTAGTSARLDVQQNCFQSGTTTVNKVKDTQTWWAILERILTDWVEEEVRIINAGDTGNTIATGLSVLEKNVFLHSPDYVLVMFGTEDALTDVEVDIFQTDLENIVNSIIERNVKPILMTPPPISGNMQADEEISSELQKQQANLSEYVRIIHNLAKEKSLPLINLHKFFLDNRLAYDHLYEGWLPDGVAQAVMAPFIAEKFLPELGINNFPGLTICDFRKVYSDAGNPETKHNAFTDLTYFEDKFFLVFRSGQTHGVPSFTSSSSEVIIVLNSKDGINWHKDAVLKKDAMDNRDPKFLQVDGQLFIYAPCSRISDRSDLPYHITYGFERTGPGKWSEPFECAPCVFWRPRKWGEQYFVASYAWKEKNAAVILLSSENGRDWKIISDILPLDTRGNETDIFIDNDTLKAFSRAASELDLLISTYNPEENNWKTVSSGRIIHAPNVFKADEKLIISGRYMSYSDEVFRDLQQDWRWFTSGDPAEEKKADISRVEKYHHGLRTGIFWMDGNRPRLLAELLSAGDCSYTGVVKYGNEYLISDYSMHEYYPGIKHPGDWNTPSDIYVWKIHFK